MNRVFIMTPEEALAGAKLTQIRRPVKQAIDQVGVPAAAMTRLSDGSWIAWWGLPTDWQAFAERAYPNGGGFASPWKSGDVLLGKQAWRLVTATKLDREAIVEYRADGHRRAVQSNCFQQAVFAGNDGWRRARSMPEWAVRYRYDVLSVRCEQAAETWFWIAEVKAREA